MQALFREMKAWAQNYIKGYYTNKENIQSMMKVKELHTDYVVENCAALAKALSLNAHDVELSRMIGLFHDIGRFEQYTKYQTFNDRLSENHAQIALAILRDLPLLDRLHPEDRDTLEFAIANHNAKEIAPTKNRRHLLFAKLIRDADKLDIYRVLEPFTEDSDGSGFSESILRCFLEEKQADYTYIKTLDDRKLVRLLWLYNIYFTWTMQQILQRGYIKHLIEKLPPDERIQTGVRHLQAYIERKMREKEKSSWNLAGL